MTPGRGWAPRACGWADWGAHACPRTIIHIYRHCLHLPAERIHNESTLAADIKESGRISHRPPQSTTTRAMVYRLLLGMECHFDGCLASIKIKPSSPWLAPIDLTRACTPTFASGGQFSVHPPLCASLSTRARLRWGWCLVQAFMGYGSIDRAQEGGRAVRIRTGVPLDVLCHTYVT